MPGNNGDDYVPYDHILYNKILGELLGLAAKRRSTRGPNYISTIETLFEILLTTDREKTGRKYFKKLAKDRGLPADVEQLRSMKEEKRDPYGKAQDTDQKREEIEWTIADIEFKAIMRTLEDYGDLSKGGPSTVNRGI